MNPIDQRIMELIDFLMYQKKFKSITAFCNEIGMKPQNYYQVKNGRCGFTVDQINNLCNQFGINANWIFGQQENQFIDKAPIDFKSLVF